VTALDEDGSAVNARERRERREEREESFFYDYNKGKDRNS
jgi:hypothetical protein